MANKLYMAGVGSIGLSCQTFCSFSFGSDKISVGDSVRPFSSDH